MIKASQLSEKTKQRIIERFQEQSASPAVIRSAAWFVVYEDLGLECHGLLDLFDSEKFNKVLDQAKTDYRGYARTALEVYLNDLMERAMDATFGPEQPKIAIDFETGNNGFGSPAPEPEKFPDGFKEQEQAEPGCVLPAGVCTICHLEHD